MNKQYGFVKAALVAIGFAAAPAFATNTIPIAPNGGGSDGTQQVGSLGWNNSFTIAINALPTGSGAITVGQVFNTFGQGTLANFNDSNGIAIGGLSLNATYEWTYVFGVQEIVTSVTATSATFAATGSTAGGGANFFNVFYDTSRNANPLNGTGFNDGTLILSGSFLPFNTGTGTGISTFTVSSPNAGALDQFGTNDYAGINTVGGAGSFNLLAAVTSANTAFFPSGPALISVTNNGFTNLAFTETNPSSCYWTGSSLSSAIGPNDTGTQPAGCNLNTVGAVNGVNGPNFAFETRSTSAFVSKVPEPASLALLGLGLAAMGWTARRKRG